MKKLKEIRKKLKISQALLAKISGISRYRISEFECGYKEPSQREKGVILAILANKQLIKREDKRGDYGN